MTEKPVRMDIKPSADLHDAIDHWRRRQHKLPPMAKAARQLIAIGLRAEGVPVDERAAEASP
jgi:hypothetical protein